MDKPLANGECTIERCGQGRYYRDAMEDGKTLGVEGFTANTTKALLKSAVNGNLMKKKTKVWVMEMTLANLRTHGLILNGKAFPTIITFSAFKLLQGV